MDITDNKNNISKTLMKELLLQAIYIEISTFHTFYYSFVLIISNYSCLIIYALSLLKYFTLIVINYFPFLFVRSLCFVKLQLLIVLMKNN